MLNGLPFTRSERRTESRDKWRKQAFYNGPAPRYEPARGNPTCTAHHRALPCKRCAGADQ